MKKIKILFLLFTIFSCQSKKDKIISIFSSENGKKWYCYSFDSSHEFYPYRVNEFYKDGRMKEYINNYSTKNLDLIPYSNLWNAERWFVINDSVVSIESEKNPISGYYHKTNRKILFMNKDSIILQGTKKGNYEGILLFTRYKK